jgi:CIC family chloride channel protein
MLLLCAVKLAATIISYASGNAGGIFAPSLYLGAMAGGVVGMLVHQFAPFPTAAPGAYALVGMGTLFAGIIRAPMTSVFMIFELTQDYQILVPLMIANMLSFAISKRFQPKPVYHALLEQNHVYLPGADTRAIAGAWRARDIMSPHFEFIPEHMSAQDAWKTVAENKINTFLVGGPEHLAGIVTRKTLEQAIHAGRGSDPIESLAAKKFEYLHADQPLEVALERFGNSDVLPVVSRRGRKVEGIITLDTILQFIQKKPA